MTPRPRGPRGVKRLGGRRLALRRPPLPRPPGRPGRCDRVAGPAGGPGVRRMPGSPPLSGVVGPPSPPRSRLQRPSWLWTPPVGRKASHFHADPLTRSLAPSSAPVLVCLGWRFFLLVGQSIQSTFVMRFFCIFRFW